MKNFIKQKAEIMVASKATHCAIAAFIFAAALFYVYWASATVRSLASLEKAKQETQELSIKVSEMESERLSLQNTVNSKLAVERGFVEVAHPTFIIKDSSKAALSFKTN